MELNTGKNVLNFGNFGVPVGNSHHIFRKERRESLGKLLFTRSIIILARSAAAAADGGKVNTILSRLFLLA